jgi:SAM-dependent methyltransferase
VFEKIAGHNRRLGEVLDVGCACGGLAAALMQRFIVASYTGIDINEAAINWAKKKQKPKIPCTFISGDIIGLHIDKDYDIVFSLSCADWNIETEKIIYTCWSKVRPGGYFVISLRLTAEKGINDIRKSYQYINFSGDEKMPEVANYVVFSFRDALGMFKELRPMPELIGAYGYWGRPSHMAVTPFDKLVFAVFYIKKPPKGSKQETKFEFDMPIDISLRG